jgi:hypothetical protein
LHPADSAGNTAAPAALPNYQPRPQRYERRQGRNGKSPMPNDNKKPVVVNTDDARAGTTGHQVRMVLVASLVAAILLMIGIAAFTLH